MNTDFAKILIDYIEKRGPNGIKELSRVVSAYCLWKEIIPQEIIDKHVLDLIIDSSRCYESIRDIARACSALIDAGIVYNSLIKRLEEGQSEGSWNCDVYDTSYALIALADAGVYNKEGCVWLMNNFSSEWKHTGTVSLIVTALSKQAQLGEHEKYSRFIDDHSKWILSQRNESGGWKYLATSNIALQALIYSGHCNELQSSIQWLENQICKSNIDQDKMSTTTAALIMISTGIYIRCIKDTNEPE
ncbi:conserved hypothetical protein [Methanosalsum zhilinae DSM 4017]|uniref:Uncharacterized protein n=1 Tax=Methanosalsum zhilinae (strain DSM 4017 / NBRC 107636 / OCM 62 / WeN5) TaxID=679901 RepID=F7XNW7_METZD|nr:hypothetical protein [Methanosalsum zhilinae]AEH60157.1 conserved hypothetical protein [Methanosalsum zhilinae DSM 4017]